MARHLCEVCGRPATVHVTAVASGVATERHLCEVHSGGACAIDRRLLDAIDRANAKLRKVDPPPSPGDGL